jgi:hypothetical protein
MTWNDCKSWIKQVLTACTVRSISKNKEQLKKMTRKKGTRFEQQIKGNWRGNIKKILEFIEPKKSVQLRSLNLVE